MFDMIYVIVLDVSVVMAYFLGRWIGVIENRKIVKEVAVDRVLCGERIHSLTLKLHASEEELEEAKLKIFLEKHPECDITNWSFEYWCQMQGMTEQEIQGLSDDEHSDLILEWKDEILSWGG